MAVRTRAHNELFRRSLDERFPTAEDDMKIRLACAYCSRDDCDGITNLKAAVGWTDIGRVQSYRQACKTYDDPSKAPAGYSIFDWWTHLGVCPDCQHHVR